MATDPRTMLQLDASKPGVLTLHAWGAAPDVGVMLSTVASAWLTSGCAPVCRCSRMPSTQSDPAGHPLPPRAQGPVCCSKD